MANEGIGVVVGLSARPDSLDEFVALAQEKMVRPTQAAPGCLRYELWQDLDEPSRFVIIEEWESEQAHAAHLVAKTTRSRLGRLDHLLLRQRNELLQRIGLR